MFSSFIELGFEHILDPKGYDHILFVAVLCALYEWSEWKKIIILVTAFTVGHSLTLGLSSLSLINIDATLIETLIPITIILTAVYNIFVVLRQKKDTQNLTTHYLMALGFGLIHGLGFSNYFKALMGEEESIFMPLLAFNIGVELGQLIIVATIFVLGFLVVGLLKLNKSYWTLGISSMAIVVSGYLLM